MKYRKRPVVIEATQFDPEMNPWPAGVEPWPDGYGVTPRDMSFGYIETLEGRMHVMAGDWIITGVKRVRGTRGEADYTKTGVQGPVSIVTNVKTGRHYADADGRETVASFDCVEGCPVRELGEMSGESVSRPDSRDGLKLVGGGGLYGEGSHRNPNDLSDTGTAARFFPNLDPPFFYAAKSSRSERNRGCDALYWLADDTRGSGYRPITRAEYEAAQAAGERVARGNMHPTVKNIKLLSWLINLLTVPGDVILDPFAGSGSIGVAALQGGRSFVGIEMDEDYLSICEHRLAHAAEQPRQMEIAV